MEVAYPCRCDGVYDLLDDDGHVACSRGHARVGGFPVEVYHPSQPVRHVFLLLLHPDDIRCRVGLRELLDKQSVENRNDASVLRCNVQDDLYS